MQHETPGSDSQLMRKCCCEPTHRAPENAENHLGVLHPPNCAVDETHHAKDCRASCCCEEQGVKHLSLPSSDLVLNVPHRNTRGKTALFRPFSRLDQQVSGWWFHHSHHSHPTHEQFPLTAEGHDFRSTKGCSFGRQVVHVLVNIVRFIAEPIGQLWLHNFFGA